MAEKSVGGRTRILVVGATGNLGRHLVEASIAAGHPTFALARDSAFSDPDKSRFLHSIAQRGVTLLKGCLEDFDGLLDAVRKVDVVISAVSGKQTLDQKLLVRAIKQAGTVKRFVPAEFGADADKVQVDGSDFDFKFYKRKSEIRRLIEKEGIPHTYVCSGFYTSYFLPSLVQPGLAKPPRDRVKIFGNGDTKAVFVKECDVASYTVCTVDDLRSLNKTLHLRPPGNICSMNDLVEMWEMKIGKKLEREYVPEERLLKIIQDTPHPENVSFIFIYLAFVKGSHTNFDVDPSSGLDGALAYPHVKHTTVDQHLNTLLSR